MRTHTHSHLEKAATRSSSWQETEELDAAGPLLAPRTRQGVQREQKAAAKGEIRGQLVSYFLINNMALKLWQKENKRAAVSFCREVM